MDYRLGAGAIVVMLLIGIGCPAERAVLEPDPDPEPTPPVIDGTVADTTGALVDGVLVSAVLGSDTVASATTAGGGAFSMEVADAGAYTVIATGKTGLTAFTGVGSVTAVESETHTIDMSAKDMHTLALAAALGDVDAIAGSTVTLPALEWRVWSREGCPGCSHTIVVGLDGTPEATLLLSVPGPYPGTTGSEAFQLTAPTTPGTYTIWATRYATGTDESLALYSERFLSSTRIDTEFLEIGTLLVSPEPPPAGSVTLSDDFESGCDAWSASATINGTGTTSEACSTSGGSDGARYREMTHQLVGVGSLVVDHTFTGGTVQVGVGALCAGAIRFQEHRIITTPSFVGAAVGANVFVLQDGARYRANATSTFSVTTWTAYDSGDLTAADFSPAGLDLCPTVATELSFGFSRSNSNTGGGTQLNIHGIDEWSVTVVPQ